MNKVHLVLFLNTSNEVIWPEKNSKFIYGLKNDNFGKFYQKSADWLDWQCPVSAALQNHPQDFVFSVIFLFIFLSMKPLYEVLPGPLSFRSRSKQCVKLHNQYWRQCSYDILSRVTSLKTSFGKVGIHLLHITIQQSS